MKKKKRRWLIILTLLGVLLGGVWLYTSSLIGVNPKSITYLNKLRTELVRQGHTPRYFIISGKRAKWHNNFLTRFGGAASQSRHLKGEAIDIIVLDVNSDGQADAKDVDIVYDILNTKIIKSAGGIGTYKNEPGFFNRQMVHFDCRGRRARWHR